jgi:hypothetical protein
MDESRRGERDPEPGERSRLRLPFDQSGRTARDHEPWQRDKVLAPLAAAPLVVSEAWSTVRTRGDLTPEDYRRLWLRQVRQSVLSSLIVFFLYLVFWIRAGWHPALFVGGEWQEDGSVVAMCKVLQLRVLWLWLVNGIGVLYLITATALLWRYHSMRVRRGVLIAHEVMRAVAVVAVILGFAFGFGYLMALCPGG